MHLLRVPGVWRCVGRALAVTLVAGATLLGASGGPSLAHGNQGHPARIHEGSCEALGPVSFPLNGVGAPADLANAPVATPTTVNPDTAYQVMLSETTIDGTLDDLLASEHALMIYASAEAMESIACGNLGGAMRGEELITGLAEAGVAGHLGFAIFTPNGDQTVVSILLGHAMAPVSASVTP
ncbi:MAG: hypothetical protein M3Z20_05125 [Chloroflexota bacterium]|nr:hypothetical protein [Chloroflexota bacterium]